MDILWNEPIYFWLIAMIVFVILELPTMGITTIWFALGSLTALAIAAVGGPMWLQVVVFLLVSFVALICFRKAVMSLFNKNRELTNAEGLIGKNAIVTEDISNLLSTGQVIVSGQEWTARSVQDDLILKKGEVVVIRAIQGVKLIVESLPEAK